MVAVNVSREQWTADGMLLTTAAYNISSFSLASPGLRGSTTQLPQRSGSIARYNRSYEPAEFGISLWVLGCNDDGTLPGSWTLQRGAFETNLRALMSVLCKQSAPITFDKTMHSGAVIRATAIPAPASVELITQMGRLRGELTFAFEVLDAFWGETTVRTDVSAAGATLPKTLPMANYAPSTAPLEDAVITVAGPITNPRVTDAESGSWVQYTGTVANGSSWVVDAGLFTSKVGGTDVRAATSHAGHARFLYVPPRYGLTAVPSLTLSGTTGGTATQLTISYRRKFLVP